MSLQATRAPDLLLSPGSRLLLEHYAKSRMSGTSRTMPTSSRRQRTMPKLKESCDCCATAKVKCSRERPACTRCLTKGSLCRYSYSRRAGRRQASDSSISSVSSIPSSPPTSSYTDSPTSSPMMMPTSTFLQRADSTSSSTSSELSDFPGLQMPLPAAPDPPLPQFINSPTPGMDMDVWPQPPYLAENLHNPWNNLTDPFSAGPTSNPRPCNTNSFFIDSASPRASRSDSSSSLADSLDFSAPSLLPQEPLIQDSLLFSETEAVREELHLVANFLGTLEERVDKGVKFARMQEQATLEAKAACESLEGIVMGEGVQMSAGSVAMQFSAADLRKRLGSVRREIECLVGFG